MKILTVCLISIAFIGCTKKDLSLGYINDCKCKSDITLNFEANECICGDIKTPPLISKNSDECPTEITQIYKSKASGKIVTCHGAILLDGQKTRIVYVNK